MRLLFTLFASALMVLPAAPGQAQSSAFVSLDDPHLPMLEHLIARGDVEDPSPLVRPFHRSDALRVLAAAESAGDPGTTARVRRLAEAWDTLPPSPSWSLAPRAGLQAYTTPRRDLLRPTGSEGVRPYLELGAMARFGALIAVTRPAIEPRLTRDPEWTGRRDLKVTGRMADAYVAANWRFVEILYGQLDRNWGPVGIAGIPLSDAGYGRPEMSLAFGTDGFRLTSIASGLQSLVDSAGQVYRRYYFAHRLGVRLSRRLRLGLWETVVVAGVDRDFDGRFRNPVTLLLLANQYGLGDKENNLMIGLDLHWRAFRRVTLAGQLAIDDVQYKNRGSATRYPDRYAFTASATGPLGRAASWRAIYSQVSSLAFRTFTPAQDYLDGGVGIGRTYDDYDQTSLFVSLPLGDRWLVTPEATLIRQGQGRIQDPVPPNHSVQAGTTPALFIGTVERSYRLAVNASGARGPLALTASAGLLHRVNADNVAGRDTDRFEGRLFVTLGITRHGTLR